MDFLYRFACEPRNFSEYGSDLVNSFYYFATRSRDDDLRRWARRAGRERARQWRRDHPALPADADAEVVYDYLYGSDSADRLGVRDRALKEQLRRAVRQFPARDYLWFDPTAEPPRDLPDQCVCGLWNGRGRKTCRRCRKKLVMLSRYVVWYSALIRAYIADGCRVSLGASYREVLEWMPEMHPYRASRKPSHPDFYDTAYAVTHVAYTLNDYMVYRLSPEWLPQEFAFLKENLREAMALEDPEMAGEFLDSLKSFGLADTHPLIRAGTKFVLSRQNADGSWGDVSTDDVYFNYHPTLCAVGCLIDIAWRGEGLTYPGLKPLLERWARGDEGMRDEG